MRTTATLLLTLAALAGCHERPTAAATDLPDNPAVRAATDPDWPLIMLASPEATNYAPPDWPLKPGDTLKDWDEMRLLDIKYGGWWGMGTVWVVGGSGTPIPFSAGFDHFSNGEPGGGPNNTYVGHLPFLSQKIGWKNGPRRTDAYYLEKALPEPLRGLVDVRDHVRVERPLPESLRRLVDVRDPMRDFYIYPKGLLQITPGGLRELLETERKRYYGRGASW